MMLRFESKVKGIKVNEMLEYFTQMDKRMAWEGAQYSTIEERLTYPLETGLYYFKLQTKNWRES